MALTMSPASGPAAGGQLVTCTAEPADMQGFDMTAMIGIGAVTVTFDNGGANPQPGTDLVGVGSHALTCRSPAHALGLVTVEVFLNTGD